MDRKVIQNGLILFVFLIPTVLISVIVYLVSFQKVSTEYNFLYVTCGGAKSYCHATQLEKRVTVTEGQSKQGGRITITNPPGEVIDEQRQIQPVADTELIPLQFYVYNATADTNQQITQEEALQIQLSSLQSSPDGVTFSNEYRGSDILFLFGGGHWRQYLRKGRTRQEVILIDSDKSYYSSNFHFVGWILK